MDKKEKNPNKWSHLAPLGGIGALALGPVAYDAITKSSEEKKKKPSNKWHIAQGLTAAGVGLGMAGLSAKNLYDTITKNSEDAFWNGFIKAAQDCGFTALETVQLLNKYAQGSQIPPISGMQQPNMQMNFGNPFTNSAPTKPQQMMPQAPQQQAAASPQIPISSVMPQKQLPQVPGAIAPIL